MSFWSPSKIVLVSLGSSLGIFESSSFCCWGFCGSWARTCVLGKKARMPAGTPAAMVVRNLRLDSMARAPPFARAIHRRTGRHFLEPLPMLYSPSHKNHAEFLQSLVEFDAPQRAPSSGDLRYRTGREPHTPRNYELVDQACGFADSISPNSRTEDADTRRRALRRGEQTLIGRRSTNRSAGVRYQRHSRGDAGGPGQPFRQFRAAATCAGTQSPALP